MFPGASSDYTKPGQPLEMGLKSDGLGAPPLGDVKLGTLRVALGYTSIHNEGILPESDVRLKTLSTVGIDTAEFTRPIGAQAVRSQFGDGIKIDAPAPVAGATAGIYSVKAKIVQDAQIMGYFKFKTKLAWSLATRDWFSTSNMTGMYFGLEHGTFNTACIAGLRGGGTGSLMIGGPMAAFGTPRPGQREITALNWLALPDNTIVEMWIYFNMVGYNPPFSPANTPVVEVWTKRGGVDTVPVFQTLATPLPVTFLGQFPGPAGLFPNFRDGPSEFATLFFGNVGTGTDSLELLDWALYPDYRVAVREGLQMGDNRLFVEPDGPVMYKATDGLPQDLSPGRWFPVPDVGYSLPSAVSFFQPGHPTAPYFTSVVKTLNGGTGFQRSEPRLVPLADGSMIEAFMSGEQTVRVNDSFGAGIMIDDGTKLFQVAMLQSPTRRTIGLVKDLAQMGDFSLGYFTNTDPALDVDWRSPKLVQMIVDRLRGKVAVFADGVRVLNENIAAMPASVAAGGRVAFGHLVPSASRGKHNLGFLNYLSRYQAWEIDEQLLPEVSPVGMTPSVFGTGYIELDPILPATATHLTIAKTAFGIFNSRSYYHKTMTFDERAGVFVDFRVRVLSYADRVGTTYAKNTWVGSGVQVFFGNKSLHLGFFDCGAHGRYIGVIPGSGTVDDIINQTALGRSHSFPIEWTEMVSYRLVYRAYNSIEVWVDNIQSGPVITIPWVDDTNGFDLPQDLTASSIAFGHFDRDAASTTAWEFFRFGFSNGYEISVQPDFGTNPPSYLFGGRSLIQSEFSE